MTSSLADIGPIEDPAHPIPNLATWDTALATDRGAYVGIVIARPLKDDSRSRARLQRKIEGTVDYFFTPTYKAKYGPPEPSKSRMRIAVHCDSDASMLSLINDYVSGISAKGISVNVDLIGTN